MVWHKCWHFSWTQRNWKVRCHTKWGLNSQFAISSVNILHHTWLTLFRWKDPFLWIKLNSPVHYCVFLQWNENMELHHKLMTSCWLAAIAFGEYLHQIRDPSWNKIKFLTFLISDVNISHHRRITSFLSIYQFPWINSPVPSSCNEMRICNDITNESLYFANSSPVWWVTPSNRWSFLQQE